MSVQLKLISFIQKKSGIQEILTHTAVLCILPENNVMFGEFHTI